MNESHDMNKDFIKFLKILDIHYLNNNDFMSALHPRSLYNHLNYYILRVVCETNQYISLILNFDDSIINIDIYLVSSLQWGELFYSLPRSIKDRVRKHISDRAMPFNISQYGFYEHRMINHNVKSLKDLEKKLNL